MAFLESSKSSSKDRAEALDLLGPPVFLGGTSTILGICLTGFCVTYVFQTFFRYLMTILILAVWFGLVVMPVVCALIGPKSRREAIVGEGATRGGGVTDAPISVFGRRADGYRHKRSFPFTSLVAERRAGFYSKIGLPAGSPLDARRVCRFSVADGGTMTPSRVVPPRSHSPSHYRRSEDISASTAPSTHPVQRGSPRPRMRRSPCSAGRASGTELSARDVASPSHSQLGDQAPRLLARTPRVYRRYPSEGTSHAVDIHLSHPRVDASAPT